MYKKNEVIGKYVICSKIDGLKSTLEKDHFHMDSICICMWQACPCGKHVNFSLGCFDWVDGASTEVQTTLISNMCTLYP